MSKKANLKKLLIPLLWLGVGAAMGLLVARILGPEITDTIAAMGPLKFALAYGSLIALVALAAFLQIIIHEGGHLVFGLATGYRFSSFRVASLMLLKRDGRYELKHLSIAGTGGQCLMIPPAYTEEGFPYKLYNLGGVIANVVSALICGLLLIPFHNNRYVMAFLASIAVIGVGYALMNGIPFGSGRCPTTAGTPCTWAKTRSHSRASGPSSQSTRSRQPARASRTCPPNGSSCLPTNSCRTA